MHISVLLHITKQSKVLKIVTPCVTFNHPLGFKSIEIIVSESLPIVSRLVGFHTLMSFLESLGKLIGGSGLNAVLETIFGKNTVDHIITDKAISTQLFPECFLNNENDFEDESNTSTILKNYVN